MTAAPSTAAPPMSIVAYGAASFRRRTSKLRNAGISDRYGKSIALSPDGTSLVIGAPGEASAAAGLDGDGTDNSVYQSGAAYLYR